MDPEHRERVGVQEVSEGTVDKTAEQLKAEADLLRAQSDRIRAEMESREIEGRHTQAMQRIENDRLVNDAEQRRKDRELEDNREYRERSTAASIKISGEDKSVLVGIGLVVAGIAVVVGGITLDAWKGKTEETNRIQACLSSGGSWEWVDNTTSKWECVK